MSTDIIPTTTREPSWDDTLDSCWTDDLTKSEAEFLLDQLEELGFPNMEVRCTERGMFAVQLPWGDPESGI